MKKCKTILFISALVLAVTACSFAQATQASATTPINVTRAESIGISVTTALPTLTIPAGSLSSDTQNVIVSSNWNLKQTRTGGVSICASLGAPLAGVNAATTGNTDTIPVNAVNIMVGGTTATPLGNGSACGISGAVQYKAYPTSAAADRKKNAMNDTIPVLVKLAGDIAADTYTGTLTLIAYSN